MSIDMKSGSRPAAERRPVGSGDGAGDDTAWPDALSWWRCLPAEAFDDVRKAHLDQCVANICSTAEVWRKAIGGEEAAAVNIALRIRPPAAITSRIDLTMTVLLRCALKDPGAAFVMSVVVRRMPLADRHKNRIAISWLVHNLLLAYPGLRHTGSLRRRSIAFQFLNGEDSAS